MQINDARKSYNQAVDANAGDADATLKSQITAVQTAIEGRRKQLADGNLQNLKNQQGVVGNEVKVNVLNQPYGSFPWIDLPMAAFTNWYNSHNFYGDLKDIESATLEDAKTFAQKYYQPQNAVLVVTGDFDEAQAKTWVEKYFGNIPSQKVDPLPSLTEPKQENLASSWQTVTGTSYDLGAGVATVEAKVIQERSGKWYYFAGGKWAKATSERDAAAKAGVFSTAPNAKGAWSFGLTGVEKGTLKISYRAEDKAGNTSLTKVYTTKIVK